MPLIIICYLGFFQLLRKPVISSINRYLIWARNGPDVTLHEEVKVTSRLLVFCPIPIGSEEVAM